jgi:hypothetical protein
MDTRSMLPSMKARELSQLASQFATNLAERLEDLNRQYSSPVLSPEAVEYVETTYGERIPGSVPSDYLQVFEGLFCRYMSSRWVIIPDDE